MSLLTGSAPATQEDLETLINEGAEENIHLEFKASGALKKTDGSKKELAKDISSIANSDGGTIIYGISEENNKASSLSFIDGSVFTKEFIELVIQDNIQRRIEGLIIEPVRIDGKMAQSVYVIRVPRSKDAPHMVGGKFYKRQNFQAVQMEEYEIRDSYNRTEKNKLICLSPIITRMFGHGKLTFFDGSIRFDVHNESTAIEKVYKIEIQIPQLLMAPSMHLNKLSDNLMRIENRYVVYSIPGNSPIFQDEILTIALMEFRVNKQSFEVAGSLPIKYKLYFSSGMEEHSFMLVDWLYFNDVHLQQTDFL